MKALFPGFSFVYIDAEFTPDDHSANGLVSLALHSERGSAYMVNRQADRERFCANDFCRDHIWSKLPRYADGTLDIGSLDVMSYAEIRDVTSQYFRELTGGQHYRRRIGIIADHGTQDMQRIHNLFRNDWFTMPEWIPRRPLMDLATLEDLAGVEEGCLPNGLKLPERSAEEAHHAMYDARWDQEVHEFLLKHSKAVRIASGVELAA